MLPGSITPLLREQYGLVGDHQLVDRCTEAERRRIRSSPDFDRVTRRVRRHVVVESSLGQQLLVPVLDAGRHAWLCGYTGAHWWGFGRFRAWPVDVARFPRKLPRDPVARIHSSVVIDESDVTIYRGVPILRPERIILWLARKDTDRFGPEIAAQRLARTLDHAWREGLIHGAYIHELARRCSGSGNTGIVALRSALESRPPDYQPADSRLEERWEEVVGPLAVRFRRQITLGDDQPIGRVDEVHVDRPIVVEINSEKFHTTLTDRALDDERSARLVAAGFVVVVYWEYDIWHDGRTVHESLRRILADPDDSPQLFRPTPAPFELLPPV